jgi:hypothetical protein
MLGLSDGKEAQLSQDQKRSMFLQGTAVIS